MRILFLNAHYHPSVGGVEIFTQRLADALIQRGHTVAVAASRFPTHALAQEKIDGVAVHRFPFLEALSLKGISPVERFATLAKTVRDFAALKATFRPDIVHVHLSDANAFFHLRAPDPVTTATVVTFHAPLTPAMASKDGVLAKLAAQADALVAVSRSTAEFASPVAARAGTPITVIPPGVPTQGFIPRTSPCKHAPAFAFVGRLVPCKGAHLAVAAMASLPDATLAFIGDGAEAPALAALAAKLGIADRVTFHGLVAIAAIPRLLRDVDALVVPSTYEEPFGIVAVEAALAGVPAIVADVGGLRDIVSSGRTGFVVPPDDVASLARAMAEIASDRGRAFAMGKAARARAVARYSLDAVTDAHVAMYKRCSAARSEGALSRTA